MRTLILALCLVVLCLCIASILAACGGGTSAPSATPGVTLCQ